MPDEGPYLYCQEALLLPVPPLPAPPLPLCDPLRLCAASWQVGGQGPSLAPTGPHPPLQAAMVQKAITKRCALVTSGS